MCLEVIMPKKANKVSFSSLSLSVCVCLCVCLYFSSVPLFLLIFLCIIIQRSNPINRLKLKNALWNDFFSRQEWASDFDQKLIFSFEMFCIHKELFCWLGPYREKQTKKQILSLRDSSWQTELLHWIFSLN